MKEIKLKIIAFCDYATVSQDNKLSLQGVFDQVIVSKFPGGVARAFFVASLRTTPNKKVKFSFKGKLENKTIFPPVEMDALVGNEGNHNIIIDLAGMNFPRPGKYNFILYQDGKEIGSIDLNVIDVNRKSYYGINKEERLVN